MIVAMARRSVLALIAAYQIGISPLLPPACRFLPRCSEYGATAVRRYGIVRGAALTLWRLLRCQPFSRGGFDPVP